MITQPVPPQHRRAHPHTHVHPPFLPTISPSVMPVHAGIQRLGLWGVRS